MSVKMVDITEKEVSFRQATAHGFIRLKSETIEAIRRGNLPKGDVLTVSKAAAILAVKRTWELIPLCHPIPITGVDVDLRVVDDGVEATVTVRSTAKTGVEMEALTGIAVALLTVWDMVKSIEKDEKGQYPLTEITGIKVVEKVKESSCVEHV